MYEQSHARGDVRHAGLTVEALSMLFWVGMFTALLTAFYTFRAFFLTFYGPEEVPPEAGHHAHESPPTMTIPLMILAVCAAVVGFAGSKHVASAIFCGGRRRWPCSRCRVGRPVKRVS